MREGRILFLAPPPKNKMLDDFSLKSWLYASETESLQRGMQSRSDTSQRLIAALQRVDPSAAVPSPRVVLVGSQSSGKSSLVNALVGLPLLPTSEEMCTKVPLYLCLSPSGDESSCCATLSVGSRVALDWQFDWHNWRGENGVARVQAAIQAASDELVSLEGDSASSFSAAAERRLHLSLRLPRCPQMSLIDLPGLTACDRGDIHGKAASAERLHNIAVEMASPLETVVVAVMAARVDVEVDLAWQVLKKIDAEGSRTAIVLTKPDLIVPSPAFRRVLVENGGGNITAQLGYYVVMLKGAFDEGGEANGQRETQFFTDEKGSYHNLQEEIPSHFGVPQVRRVLGDVGHRLIVDNLPLITKTLGDHQATLEERLRDLGDDDDLPLQNPVAWLSYTVRKMLAILRESLRGRHSSHIVVGGTPIAAALTRLREAILSLRPLETPDEGDEARSDSSGIHLPELSIVALLENLVRISTEDQHLALVEVCLGEISQAVVEASDYACHKSFSRHRGALVSRIRGIVVQECAAASARCRQEASQMLQAEENVWCDTAAFRSALSCGDVAASVKAYQEDLSGHISCYLPRLLVHGMTTRLLNELDVAVMKKILSATDGVLAHEDLLRELISEGSEERRKVKSELEAAKSAVALARQVGGSSAPL